MYESNTESDEDEGKSHPDDVLHERTEVHQLVQQDLGWKK